MYIRDCADWVASPRYLGRTDVMEQLLRANEKLRPAVR